MRKKVCTPINNSNRVFDLRFNIIAPQEMAFFGRNGFDYFSLLSQDLYAKFCFCCYVRKN